ncbi:hypothetical protein [Peribacillus simplex]|nr:hypothetical protein [Peribacillus simplex]
MATNAHLGKMITAHQKGTTWSSIVSTLVFADGPTVALASALVASPNG